MAPRALLVIALPVLLLLPGAANLWAPSSTDRAEALGQQAIQPQGMATSSSSPVRIDAVAHPSARAGHPLANGSQPDTTPPAIVITSPVDNASFNSTSVTVTGTASDDVEVAKVELSRDGVTWSLASGTTAWSGALTLSEGTNTIRARATDTSGNTAEASISLIVHVPPPTRRSGGLSTGAIVAIVGVAAAGGVGAAVALSRKSSKKKP